MWTLIGVAVWSAVNLAWSFWVTTEIDALWESVEHLKERLDKDE